MPVKSFSFEDRVESWTLRRCQFQAFNLLVGLSGVGKSRVLRALTRARGAGLAEKGTPNGCAWELEIEAEGQVFRWKAETSTVSPFATTDGTAGGDRRESDDRPEFELESVSVGDRAIVERVGSDLRFEGTRLPKLKRTESAVALLHDNPSLAPLHRALQRFQISSADDFQRVSLSSRTERDARRFTSLQALRDEVDMSIVDKLDSLQSGFPGEFAEFVARYRAVFPTVEDLCIGDLTALDPRFGVHVVGDRSLRTVAIRERDVAQWVVAPQLSSGMWRTCVHLAEVMLAPTGAVIVVDDYENSLGVNCLPAVTEEFVARKAEIQFILTSHHPFVINAVPRSEWQLVSRRGSTVSVVPAGQIPALQTRSAQDPFTLLTNATAYVEAIA